MKTPNQKQFLAAAVLAGSGVLGAKISDGVMAIFPESTNSYKRWIGFGLGIVLAAFGSTVNGTAGTALTGFGLGMATKQGNDAVTELIKPRIAPKDNSTLTGKFMNAIAGYNETEASTLSAISSQSRAALNAAFVDEATEIESFQRTPFVAVPSFVG